MQVVVAHVNDFAGVAVLDVLVAVVLPNEGSCVSSSADLWLSGLFYEFFTLQSLLSKQQSQESALLWLLRT